MTDFALSRSVAFQVAALVASGVAVGYLLGKYCEQRTLRINNEISVEAAKVADTVPFNEIQRKKDGDSCERFACQWPYCDGAHKQHNKETGDNVGPLRITDPSPASE